MLFRRCCRHCHRRCRRSRSRSARPHCLRRRCYRIPRIRPSLTTHRRACSGGRCSTLFFCGFWKRKNEGKLFFFLVSLFLFSLSLSLPLLRSSSYSSSSSSRPSRCRRRPLTTGQPVFFIRVEFNFAGKDGNSKRRLKEVSFFFNETTDWERERGAKEEGRRKTESNFHLFVLFLLVFPRRGRGEVQREDRLGRYSKL